MQLKRLEFSFGIKQNTKQNINKSYLTDRTQSRIKHDQMCVFIFINLGVPMAQ